MLRARKSFAFIGWGLGALMTAAVVAPTSVGRAQTAGTEPPGEKAAAAKGGKAKPEAAASGKAKPDTAPSAANTDGTTASEPKAAKRSKQAKAKAKDAMPSADAVAAGGAPPGAGAAKATATGHEERPGASSTANAARATAVPGSGAATPLSTRETGPATKPQPGSPAATGTAAPVASNAQTKPGAKPAPATPAAKPGPKCSLVEAEQPRGGQLELVGTGFGASPIVRVAGKPVRMIERREDKISVQVPADSEGGPVAVQAQGVLQPCGTLVIIGKNR